MQKESVFEAFENLKHSDKMKYKTIILYCGVKEDNEEFIEDHSEYIYCDTYSINGLC